MPTRSGCISVAFVVCLTLSGVSLVQPLCWANQVSTQSTTSWVHEVAPATDGRIFCPPLHPWGGTCCSRDTWCGQEVPAGRPSRQGAHLGAELENPEECDLGVRNDLLQRHQEASQNALKSADLSVPEQYNRLSACPLCAFSHSLTLGPFRQSFWLFISDLRPFEGQRR